MQMYQSCPAVIYLAATQLAKCSPPGMSLRDLNARVSHPRRIPQYCTLVQLCLTYTSPHAPSAGLLTCTHTARGHMWPPQAVKACAERAQQGRPGSPAPPVFSPLGVPAHKLAISAHTHQLLCCCSRSLSAL